MKSYAAVVVAALIAAGGAGARESSLKLTSTDVHEGQTIAAAQIASVMGCTGSNVSPRGDTPHHYRFTLFALDTERLDVPAGATAAYVGFNVHAQTLAKSELTALYGR